MILYWFLPMVLLLGFATSYEDLRWGKVRNKWIALAVGYSLAVYLLLYLFFPSYGLGPSAFYTTMVNAIIGLVVGFLFWQSKFWTAGDAKLFFAFLLLLPPVTGIQIDTFRFMDVLINATVPLALFLVFSGVERTSFKQKADSFKALFRPSKVVRAALLLFAFIWPVAQGMQYLGIRQYSPLVLLLLMLLIMRRGLLDNRIALVGLSLLAAGRLLLDPILLTPAGWIQFLIIFAIYLVLRYILSGIVPSAFTKEIPLSSLQEGMVPAELVVKQGKSYQKEAMPLGGRPLPDSGNKPLFVADPGGLSKGQVNDIKKTLKGSKIKTLEVQECLSFAPFLFAGTLLAVFLEENLLTYIILVFML